MQLTVEDCVLDTDEERTTLVSGSDVDGSNGSPYVDDINV